MIKWIENLFRKVAKPLAPKTYVVFVKVHAWNEKRGRTEVVSFATKVCARSRRVAMATTGKELKMNVVKAHLVKS